MQILVDTSVWIDHLRIENLALILLLENDVVFGHPWVKGELALGSLKDWGGFLEVLGLLPAVDVIADDRVLDLIDRHRLFNLGIGWVDAQLLAACQEYPCRLWTKDRRLAAVAQNMGIGWEPA